MPPMTSETIRRFWRCDRCGTPNPSASYLTKCLGCGRPIPPYQTKGSEPAPSTGPATPTVARGRKTLIAAGLFGVCTLASIGMIRGMAFGWWLVAALAFMPRWLFAVPLLLLAFGAIRARRIPVAAVVILDAWLVLGPLMGFSVPIARWFSGATDGPRVRIMSINLGPGQVDLPQLVRYLDHYRIDVVCFQESSPGSVVGQALTEAGWHLDRSDRVASRFPIVSDLGRSTDVNKSDQRYPMTIFRVRLKHPEGFEFLVGSTHMPTPRRALDSLMARRYEAFRNHLAWWDEEAGRLREVLDDSGDLPMLVGGDFNMPSDYSGMVSIRSTYHSAYEQAGWGYGYTRPTELPWVRIDHVLASRDWIFTRSWVGPDLGSDHLPIIAEAVLTRGNAKH